MAITFSLLPAIAPPASGPLNKSPLFESLQVTMATPKQSAGIPTGATYSLAEETAQSACGTLPQAVA